MKLFKKKKKQTTFEQRPYCIAINSGGTWRLMEWDKDGGILQTKKEVKESLRLLNEQDLSERPYFMLLKSVGKLSEDKLREGATIVEEIKLYMAPIWSASYIITVVHPSYGLRLQATVSYEPTEDDLLEFITRYADTKHLEGSTIYVHKHIKAISVDELMTKED